MNKKEQSAAWAVDQYDPDNWLVIPEFGVNPRDVLFKGFQFPIVTPNSKGYELSLLTRQQVRTARLLLKSFVPTMRGYHKCAGGAIELLRTKWDGQTALPKMTKQQKMSLSYFLFLQPFLQQIGRIEQGRIGVDLAEVRAQETLMHMTAVALNGDISTDLEELKKLRMSATARGIKAAEARHNKPGGTREKREEIRSVWKSGKYTTKQLCAEEEYLAIGMSYDAARKALRNMEKPT